jgi:putative adenylate-forming enzyme
VKLSQGIGFLSAYARARRVDALTDRAAIDKLQARWLGKLKLDVSRDSSFYRPYAGVPWAHWPVIDKATWMGAFDAINTVGARHEDIAAIAARAEQTRDFSLTWGRYTVGMSTGTSGNRGLFLVSPEEGALWAGTLLGRVLRGGLLARERIALVLRAGATLYDAIGALRLQFRFFDQARPWQALAQDLCAFAPTILIAPASALRLLAEHVGQLAPRRVVSVAEVLDDLDRRRIERRFAVPVEQIYQATEGLLGTSCERGTIHLNEPYILVEPEWLDHERTRFVPVLTDLWRRTQPVIRYRLDDVLQVAANPCACGRAAMSLAAIEGRSDDVLWLDGSHAAVPVFPDLITRTIVSCLPDLEDFQVLELERGAWRIDLKPLPSETGQRELLTRCRALILQLGGRPPDIQITELPAIRSAGKQRRVRGERRVACAS